MAGSNFDHARAIGEKLRAVRQEKRISLRDLATRAETSASMLSQIETGKAYPSVRSIYSIAAALDVPVDYFFPEPDNGGYLVEEIDEETSRNLTASEMRERQVARTGDTQPTGHQRAPSNVSVMTADNRPTIELNGGVTWARLTGTAEPNLEFLEITYEPGATSGANMSHHGGREFGVILQGELVVELGFDAYHLHPGDSIIFDSTTPHRLVNNTSEPTRALWVVLNQP
jgi:transcriptional regulator with XRE-family HTH domain